MHVSFFLLLGGTLELHFCILGLRLGTLGIHFGVFLRPWTPFATFLEKARKRYTKGQKKGAEMDAFSMEFRVFPESGKLRFDCAGASGLRFRPLVFWLCVSTFTLPFLHRFLMVFGPRREPRFMGFWYVGGRGGTSLLLFNKAHSESSLYHRARSAPGLLPTA